MKISERLQKRLAVDLDLGVDLPERIRRGWSGKSAGQFAWIASRKSGYGYGDIGSEDTMSDCVKADRLEGHWHPSTSTYCITAIWDKKG